MRKTILLSGLLASFATPAFAQADSDSGQVAVQANVAPLCILGDPSRAVVDLLQIVNTAGTRAGRLATIGAQTVTLPDSFCNFAGTTVTAEVDALVGPGTGSPPANFARAVNYTATVSGWAETSASATSEAGVAGTPLTGTGTGGVQGAPKLADLVVTLDGFSVPGDRLLVAGNYNGTVRVTLGPAAAVGGSEEK